jgi:hypothetical protein
MKTSNNIIIPILKEEVGFVYSANGKTSSELIKLLTESISSKGTFVQFDSSFIFESYISKICLIITILTLKDEIDKINNTNFVVQIQHCRGDKRESIY